MRAATMTHQLYLELGYSGTVIGVNFFIHGLMIMLGRLVFRAPSRHPGVWGATVDTARLVLIALWMVLAHFFAVCIWALLFLRTGMSSSFEEALYYSLTTYTTLGFGDIIPPVGWRILTGASSLNGLLQLGLSAAVLVDATHRMRNGPRHLRG